MKRSIVTLILFVSLFATSCSQKEKGNATIRDGGEDDLYTIGGKEADVYNDERQDIEDYSWTSGGYWPTEGNFLIDEDGTIIGFEYGLSHVVVPARINGVPVKAIGNTVFLEKGLTNVTLPVGLQSIGARAFAKNQLTSITIPEGVSFIGDGAFENNKLTSVIIPDSITSLSDRLFDQNQLASVTIPGSVTSIGNRAFRINPLTSITLGGDLVLLGAFPEDFINFYDANGKKAGTYVRDNRQWSMK